VNSEDANNFSYLNRDGRWPNFQLQGLELGADGALRLHALPRLESRLPSELSTAEAPKGPGGIAVAVDGTIYFSDPAGHKLLRIDGCDREVTEVPCVGTLGTAPAQLNAPAGILIPTHREALYVADSKNHRIQIFDMASWQLVDIWGRIDAAGEPQASTDVGRFDTPWTLAGDKDGNVYVVDYGNGRVQKFNPIGDVLPAFWDNLRTTGLQRPVDIAAAAVKGTTELYIVAQDATGRWMVFVSDTEGHPVRDTRGSPLTFGLGQLLKPMGISADAGAVYVGDNHRKRVLVFKRDDFKRDGSFILAGEAVGYYGPVGSLALAIPNNLFVHPVPGIAPVPLAINRGFSTRGMMWSEGIKVRNSQVRWHRVQAMTEELATGAHLRMFVHTADDPTDAPTVVPGAPHPFNDQKWRPTLAATDQFSDVADLFIGGKPAKYVWIGAVFIGDGRETPVVSQIRIEFNHETYLNWLPAIYRSKTSCDDFLNRFLSLFESLFTDIEGQIDALPILFDQAAVPAEFLPWLARWLGLELEEDWNEALQRRMISTAFDRYSRRGTAIGLRETLRLSARLEAIVEEPILHAAWWALPAKKVSCKEQETESREAAWHGTENSILGVTTMLATATPDGAVVGSTATLDRSHLIPNEQFGAPLFEAVAHQFSVQVYRGQLKGAEALTRVRALIEREKPAHTSYHLCILEPRMRVGFQARLGIDTVVAGPPAPTKLGDTTSRGDKQIVLGGRPLGRVGVESRIGVTTRMH
jgi:phage tail-like protein